MNRVSVSQQQIHLQIHMNQLQLQQVQVQKSYQRREVRQIYMVLDLDMEHVKSKSMLEDNSNQKIQWQLEMIDQLLLLNFSISLFKEKHMSMEVVLDIKDGGQIQFIKMILLENQTFKMFMEIITTDNSKDSSKHQKQDNIDSITTVELNRNPSSIDNTKLELIAENNYRLLSKDTESLSQNHFCIQHNNQCQQCHKQESKMQKLQMEANKDIQIYSQLISITTESFQTHILEAIPSMILTLVAQDYEVFLTQMFKITSVTTFLVMLSIFRMQLYQSDSTAAAFWITNPKNTFFNNRIEGAEWYGFYLAFQSNPSDVASAADICPSGVSLLNFTNNAAHSTGKIGLRIGNLIPKMAQCGSHKNDALDDPFSANPSLNQLSGFITWANAQIGVLVDN
ncbi:unnamed protein product [Paramecium sonneborni]|uniref:CEMIP beta-helix domain-containing protein n=1 Tax=Paramecium sonneborni TaxID=65129 RepID=A0A8S1QS49_9CILI|nr:unnamed protein product [Paramecium sonneborni]